MDGAPGLLGGSGEVQIRFVVSQVSKFGRPGAPGTRGRGGSQNESVGVVANVRKGGADWQFFQFIKMALREILS
jgi:hypothetical protein